MDKLIFNTFPKTGTMWLNECLIEAYPKNLIVFGHHKISTFDKEKNIITTLRNPLDCLSSLMIFFNIHNEEQAINWYLNFYFKIINNKKVFLTKFENIINNPYISLKMYSKKFKLPEPEKINKEKITKKMNLIYPNHMPRKTTKEKIEVSKLIKSNNKFDNALDLYKNLLIYSDELN